MLPRSVASLLLLSLLSALGGCRDSRRIPPVAVERARLPFAVETLPGAASYQPVTDRALDLLRTSGAGLAVIDLDGDGLPDLVTAAPAERGTGVPRCALFRNLGGGKWQDVTPGSGLEAARGWTGFGAADVDNDGIVDLLLTGPEGVALFRGLGGLHFREVTAGSGLAAHGWCSSSAFGDFDHDGLVDVYVGGYVAMPPEAPRFAILGTSPVTGEKVVAAAPASLYPGRPGRLYRNLGGGRFTDVTTVSGLGDVGGKTLGVAFADLNGDGWPDLYLANDQAPAELFLNGAGRRFHKIDSLEGAAFGRDGEILSLHGCDTADFDHKAGVDLAAGAGSGQELALFRNQRPGRWEEAGHAGGVGPVTHQLTSNGVLFEDLDNDGWDDLAVANGSWATTADRLSSFPGFRQPFQLFKNLDGGFFQQAARPGAASLLDQPLAGRGIATGDFDGDGKVDLAVSHLDGLPLLLHNAAPSGGHWLTVRLRGHRSNSLGIGARVTTLAGRLRQVKELRTSRGYLSSSDACVHFGMAAAGAVDELRIQWPSGKAQILHGVAADRGITVDEVRGLLPAARPVAAETPGSSGPSR